MSRCVKKQLFAYFSGFRLVLRPSRWAFRDLLVTFRCRHGHRLSRTTPRHVSIITNIAKKYVLANTQSEFGSFVLRVSCMKCSEPDENIAWGDIEGPWRVLYELYSLKMPWTKIKKFVEKTEQYPLIIPMSGYWLTLQPNLWSGTESKQNRITNSSQPWPSKNKLSSQAFDFGLFLLFAGGIPFHSSKFSTTTFELMVSGHWTTSIFNLGYP